MPALMYYLQDFVHIHLPVCLHIWNCTILCVYVECVYLFFNKNKYSTEPLLLVNLSLKNCSYFIFFIKIKVILFYVIYFLALLSFSNFSYHSNWIQLGIAMTTTTSISIHHLTGCLSFPHLPQLSKRKIHPQRKLKIK